MSLSPESGARPPHGRVSGPSIDGHVVFFYYDDLAAPTAFYGGDLGLEQTRDIGWVRFFRIGATGEVAIVKAGPDSYFAPQSNNAVMLSIVTDELDAWYRRLKANNGIRFLLDLQVHRKAPIRNFLISDPGGYAIEFYQWTG